MSDPELPVDPDIDLSVPRQRAELSAATLLAISAGGVLGALARYGIGVAFPDSPWATFGINVAGCLLIGILMAAITERTHPLLRPFLGVGILGGFTTFSTYVVDALTAGTPRTALIYLAATLAAALTAVYAGTRLTHWLTK